MDGYKDFNKLRKNKRDYATWKRRIPLSQRTQTFLQAANDAPAVSQKGKKWRWKSVRVRQYMADRSKKLVEMVEFHENAKNGFWGILRLLPGYYAAVKWLEKRRSSEKFRHRFRQQSALMVLMGFLKIFSLSAAAVSTISCGDGSHNTRPDVEDPADYFQCDELSLKITRLDNKLTITFLDANNQPQTQSCELDGTEQKLWDQAGVELWITASNEVKWVRTGSVDVGGDDLTVIDTRIVRANQQAEKTVRTENDFEHTVYFGDTDGIVQYKAEVEVAPDGTAKAKFYDMGGNDKGTQGVTVTYAYDTSVTYVVDNLTDSSAVGPASVTVNQPAVHTNVDYSMAKRGRFSGFKKTNGDYIIDYKAESGKMKSFTVTPDGALHPVHSDGEYQIKVTADNQIYYTSPITGGSSIIAVNPGIKAEGSLMVEQEKMGSTKADCTYNVHFVNQKSGLVDYYGALVFNGSAWTIDVKDKQGNIIQTGIPVLEVSKLSTMQYEYKFDVDIPSSVFKGEVEFIVDMTSGDLKSTTWTHQ